MVNIKEWMPQEKSLHTSVNCMIVPNTWGGGGGSVFADVRKNWCSKNFT